ISSSAVATCADIASRRSMPNACSTHMNTEDFVRQRRDFHAHPKPAGGLRRGISVTRPRTIIPRPRGDVHLADVGELDGIANEIEQNLREALLVPEANGERLVQSDSVAARTVSTTLSMAYSLMFKVN